MFQDMRNDIISIHIPSEIKNPFKHLVQNWPNLTFFAVLKHTLDYSTSELMNTHLVNASFESFHYKLNFLRVDLFNNLLDYMVAIRIFNTINNSLLDFFNDFILKRRW